MRITYLIIKAACLTVSFLCLLPHNNLSATIQKAAIKGRYDVQNRVFEGVVTYVITCLSEVELTFHLPPNRLASTDWRAEFTITEADGVENVFERSDLGGLKRFHKKLLHAPKSIEVLEVSLDDRPISFSIVDNVYLPPLNYTKKALLKASLKNPDKVCDQNKRISITFKTEFGDISKERVVLLWDFAPRPVNSIQGKLDLADHWSKPIRYDYDIVLSGQTPQEEIHFQASKIDILPTLIVKGHTKVDEEIALTMDDYLKNSADFFIKRIKKVKGFLKERQWIQDTDFNQHIAIWDGPLTITGNHILLPHHLFRYYSIYYKTFEVVILKAFIKSALLKRFHVNSVQYPWMVPAISSEIIRDYFLYEYNGNTRFFPWGQWLNPEFHQQNSLNPWLSFRGEKKLIAADKNKYLHLLSNVYHPWYEKGFHLFRTIAENNEEMQSQIYPALQLILQHDGKELPILNKKGFVDILNLSDKQTTKIDRWLSSEGTVDYKIEEVDNVEKENQIETTVAVANLGNVSPPFEINFTLENGLVIKKEVTLGKGAYSYALPSSPVKIHLDPDHTLLENNLLNNYWATPYKVRPIWDFPSASSWLVTITPVINGNTFDKNLFGLSFSISYLNKTEFYISGWRSGGDEQILWESNFVHYGFPWQGSELYLETSELYAAYSKLVGYKQNFTDIHEDLWFSIDLMDETLDKLDEDESSDNDTWQSIDMNLSFPIFNGDFSDSTMKLFSGYGINTEDSAKDFYRQGFSNYSIWYLDNWKLHLSLSGDYSYGLVPLQKKYPIGGTEALPGFPREEELLYDQRVITGIGMTFPPYLTHTNLNFLRLGWLDKVETSLFMHWAEGNSKGMEQPDPYRDVELRFNFTVSWLNMYEGDGVFALAQPIGHEKYKDYRIILFSNWVF